MNTFAKLATAAAVVGALAVPLATPSQAAWHHHGDRGAAAAVGFGAGALIGAAAANAAYGQGYYDQGYYGNGYDSYAAEPGPGYEAGYAYGPSYGGSYRGYGHNDSNVREHLCMLSPGNPNYIPCDNKF